MNDENKIIFSALKNQTNCASYRKSKKYPGNLPTPLLRPSLFMETDLMKNLIAFFIITFLFAACESETGTECTTEIDEYIPIETSLNDLRSISFSQNEEMANTGKVMAYKNYLLVNEVGKGIHVLDNSDSQNLTKIGFIEILGNRDMAVKDDILYADNYVDLLSIDISTITNPTLIDIEEFVFNSGYITDATASNPSAPFIVAYEATGKQVTVPCVDDNVIFLIDGTTTSTSDVKAPLNISGSLSRFTIEGDQLYAVDDFKLNTFDISSTSEIDVLGQQIVEAGLETIFYVDSALYIGGQFGMHIYDLSNPLEPAYASSLQHVDSCDPVIVDNEIAYVTLSSSSTCGGDVNDLVSVDVSDIYAPATINVMNMSNPKGLAIQGNNLFICEQAQGVRIYDKDVLVDYISDQVGKIEDIFANDIILLPGNIAVVLTETGVAKFDVSDLSNITKISEYNF